MLHFNEDLRGIFVMVTIEVTVMNCGSVLCKEL